jgi:hypothetical protein
MPTTAIGSARSTSSTCERICRASKANLTDDIPATRDDESTIVSPSATISLRLIHQFFQNIII